MVYRAAAGVGQQVIVIQPNCSMSWQGQLLAFACISTVTMGIGVACLFVGLPLVLPFSGLEVGALGGALYLSARRGEVREVLTIDERAIAVESGHRSAERRAEFQRHWARVVVERPGACAWYPSRLLLRSHGRQVEVGRFLNEQERQGLALELRRALRQAPG
jgi:uncharacterized membrane protein